MKATLGEETEIGIRFTLMESADYFKMPKGTVIKKQILARKVVLEVPHPLQFFIAREVKLKFGEFITKANWIIYISQTGGAFATTKAATQTKCLGLLLQRLQRVPYAVEPDRLLTSILKFAGAQSI